MSRSKIVIRFRLAEKCCGKFLWSDGKINWCARCGAISVHEGSEQRVYGKGVK